MKKQKNIWRKYEAEKQKIIKKAKSSEEYSRIIKKLIDKLGI